MSLAVSAAVSLPEHSTPAEGDLLLERTHAAVLLVLVCIGFFAVVDLGIPADRFRTAYALKGTHGVLMLVLLGLLRWRPTPQVAWWVALGTVNLSYALFAVGDVVKGHEATSPLLCITSAMGAAALLPWGLTAQLVTAVTTSLGNAIVLRVTGSTWNALVDPAASMLAAQGVAVYVALELDRFRRERRNVEQHLAVRARTEALRAEVRVALSDVQPATDRLGRCVQAIATELGVRVAAVLAFDGRQLRVRALAGLETRAGAELGRLGERRTVVAYLQQPHPHVLSASATDGSIVDAVWATRLGLEFVALCPLVAGGEVMGMLVVLADTPPSERILESLRAVADTLAGGIVHVRTEEAKAQLLTELERANKVKSEFVSTMSHELRTPLNVIMGYADMLGDPGYPDPGFALGRIRQANNELLELIEATLDLNRLESGRDEPSYAEVSLEDLWHELAAEFAPAAARAELTVTWSGTAAMALRTDRRKLKTILKNLVANALKFTARGGVTVHAEQRDGQCVMTVQDTGIGIPADALPHIFEMFRQVDSSDRRSHGGVGLGLHIVQRLCTQLAGEIGVTSQVGRGTTFTVRLPVAPSVVCAA